MKDNSTPDEVVFKLTPIEVRVLRRILELSEEWFSNHSCNDFFVKDEINGTSEDGLAMLEAMVKSGAANEEELEDADGECLCDFQLFDHFKRRFGG
jgi:hypothetical protein